MSGRAGPLIRIVWRAILYSVALGFPSTIVFVLISTWQSYGSYWPGVQYAILTNVIVGAVAS